MLKLTPLLVIISLFLLTSCDDNNLNEPNIPGNPGNPLEPNPPVTINFGSASIFVNENENNGTEVLIPFSSASVGEGAIEIEFQSKDAGYGEFFTTNPAMVNGVLILTVQPGQTQAGFSLSALNNDLLNGHKEILFKIAKVTGSVQKGTNVSQLLNLIDDELVAKPKSFETFAGDFVKKVFEYDTKGRIAKVKWETRTPFTRTGTDTYYYNDNGQLIRINQYPGIDKHFIWSNGRIVRSEEFNHGNMKGYEEYYYDDFGNISANTIYNIQNSGEFKLTMVIDYLYFLDGNIYKSIMSAPVEGSDEFITLSTKTYDGYIEESNPFPMVEILPTVKSQTKLATYYRVVESDFDYEYQISYQFNDDGNIVSRSASSTVGSQTTQYSYY